MKARQRAVESMSRVWLRHYLYASYESHPTWHSNARLWYVIEARVERSGQVTLVTKEVRGVEKVSQPPVIMCFCTAERPAASEGQTLLEFFCEYIDKV